MKNIRFKEVLCVIILLVFIFLITNNNKISDAVPQEVFGAVCGSVNVDGLKKSKNEKFKKEFGFSVGEFESVYYMSSDSVMDVREILIVKLSETSPTDELTDSIKKRVEEKQALFKGYAPEQSALLEKYVFQKKGGFIFFAVSDEPNKALTAFRKAL